MKKSAADSRKNAKGRKGKEEATVGEHDGNVEEDIFAIVPPNGGWGWLVVFCAFYCNVVADGIQLTFGVFLKSISTDLNADYSEVALAGSLMFGIHLLMGPVCCGFNSAFGLRPVTIIGSLICSFGIGLSYFSPNYWCLCVTFGIIGGIGLGLVYMNTLVITSLYFTTLLPAAIAVVVSGTGIGTMVFAALGSFLLRQTNWQNSFLLEAALAGSMAIAAIAFRPLKPLRVKLSIESRATYQSKGEDSEDKTSEKKKALLIKTEVPKMESFNSLNSVQNAARGFAETAISGEFIQTYYKHRFWKLFSWFQKRQPKESDCLVLSEVQDQNPVDEQPRRRSYVEKTVRIGNEGGKEIEREDSFSINRIHSSVSYRTVYTRIDIPGEKLKNKVWQNLKKPIIAMLDFRLLKSFSYSLFVIIGATQLSSMLIVLIYEKDRCETLGFTEEMSVYFIVAIGASNVFWRLFLGGVAVIPGVNNVALGVSGMVFGGIATLVSGFNSHVLYQFAFCFCFALAMASFAVFRMPFLVEMVGVERIENATGISLLFMGVLCIIAPPLFGWILEMTKSYNPMFIATGIIIIVTGLLQLAVRKKINIKKRPRVPDEESS